jgi:hypothetical protein
LENVDYLPTLDVGAFSNTITDEYIKFSGTIENWGEGIDQLSGNLLPDAVAQEVDQGIKMLDQQLGGTLTHIGEELEIFGQNFEGLLGRRTTTLNTPSYRLVPFLLRFAKTQNTWPTIHRRPSCSRPLVTVKSTHARLSSFSGSR